MDPASNKMRTARIEDNNRKMAARNEDPDRDRAVYNRKMAARNEHNGQEGS